MFFGVVFAAALSFADPHGRIPLVEEMLLEKNFVPAQVQAFLSDPRFTPYARDELKPEGMSWAEFEQKKLLTPESFANGKEFLKKWQWALNAAQGKHQVNRYALTALIRVESNFGDPPEDLGAFVAPRVFLTRILTNGESS